jgi:hypothetical protein
VIATENLAPATTLLIALGAQSPVRVISNLLPKDASIGAVAPYVTVTAGAVKLFNAATAPVETFSCRLPSAIVLAPVNFGNLLVDPVPVTGLVRAFCLLLNVVQLADDRQPNTDPDAVSQVIVFVVRVSPVLKVSVTSLASRADCRSV